jgi:hypothetical protein
MACDCTKQYDVKLIIHICRACDYYKTSKVATSGGIITFELCGATPGRAIEGIAKDGGCPNCKWPKK